MSLRFAFHKQLLQETPTNYNLFPGQESEWSLCAPIAANRAHTTPVKQSLEKSVTHDIRSPLEKFNPSHVSHASTASGLPVTLLHFTNKRQIFDIAPIPHKQGKEPHSNVKVIQKRDWCYYYSYFVHSVLSPSGSSPSSPGAFQRNQICIAI